MQILLHGKSSHAAAPEDGTSPAAAMAQLMQELPTLGSGTISDPDFGLSTLTHARLGAPTFGIAPGEGEIRVTLRSTTDARMNTIVEAAEALRARAQSQLRVEVAWHEIFFATNNSSIATDLARTAANTEQRPIREMKHPMRWSEDFGRFGCEDTEATMLFLGAGENQPQLHNPDYDFPDALLPGGIGLFSKITTQILGPKAS
jgi:metal-dependent amidase/aminoacylase/carboxypeptidase family protein